MHFDKGVDFILTDIGVCLANYFAYLFEKYFGAYNDGK